MQKQFIKYLREFTSDNTSFVDEIASVLDIGYDAAYRRINLKTSLSLEEAVILARHYKISLNKLFEVGNPGTIVAQVSPLINNITELEQWFRSSLENLRPLKNIKGVQFIYTAKDIPVFHSLTDSTLTRFKMYVWLKDGDLSLSESKISYEEFERNMPSSLLESAISLGKAYEDIDIIEIWNDYSIIGSLQQVLYYFQSGSLLKENALKVCDDLDEIIHLIQRQTLRQSLSKSKNSGLFQLYKSELHTLDNALMVVTPKGKRFFNTFTVLSYMIIEHQQTCEVIYEFLKKRMANSKLLINAGERDISLFFKKIHRKIDVVRQKIQFEEQLDFL